MATTSISNLLKSKSGGLNPFAIEQNVEKGKIWVYSPGALCTNFVSGFCWCAPGTGTAIIEIWGASGSSARMCCCGGSVPGNAGAYSKRTISVTAGCYICGYVGRSCGNGDALCFRGCGEYTGLNWWGNNGSTGCMCAQGGRGGTTYCSTGTSLWCCFYSGGFCGTQSPSGCDNCGLICNWGSGWWMACAYGGEYNCCGGFSCTSFFGCYPQCICYFQQHIKTSPGMVALGGSVITHGTENNNEFSNWSGQGKHQSLHTLSAASRWPSTGVPFNNCWGFSGSCGCYENNGCIKNMPPGMPGSSSWPCGDVRDQGITGGDGLVRIKFI